MRESLSSAFEHACSSKVFPCSIDKSVEFSLPLSDKLSDSKLSYLQNLPPGRYVLVCYEVDSRRKFSVLRVDVHHAEFICSGYLR
jgi:hypothetical protein